MDHPVHSEEAGRDRTAAPLARKPGGGIRALQAAGRLPAELDVEVRAAALLTAIQGGVSILLSTGQSTHLRAALDQGIADLRRAGCSVA